MSNQLIFVIILALIFEFLNGMRDSSNIVATMISSRAFRPQTALGITAVVEFLAPFLFGVVVAQTISREIVNSQLLTLDAIIACLVQKKKEMSPGCSKVFSRQRMSEEERRKSRKPTVGQNTQ